MTARTESNQQPASGLPPEAAHGLAARGRVSNVWAALGVALVALLVGWVRSIPADPDPVDLAWAGAPAPSYPRADYVYTGGDGKKYVYPGGYDSYAWIGSARKLIATGSVCDEVVDGVCIDTTSLAPEGRTVQYPGSLHVRAIAALHRALSRLAPGRPLSASAYSVSIVVGVAAVVPAFLIGFRLAGIFGGLLTALVSGLNLLLLRRSFGADNDIWNFFFPALLVWMSTEAILSRNLVRGIAWSALAGAIIGPYAMTWNGWPFAWVIALSGLIANALLLAAADLAGRRNPDTRQRNAWAIAAVFFSTAGVAVHWSGSSIDYFDLLSVLWDNPILATIAHADGGAGLSWPENYSTVGELYSPTMTEVAAWFGGRLPLFGAWLGLVLMLLPRRDWAQYHFIVFIAGVLLYRLLFALEQQSRQLMVAAIALPLVTALGLYAADSRDGARRRAAISIVVWFLGSLFLGLGARRFLLLMVLPFAVAVAVAADRLLGSVERLASDTWPRLRGLGTALAFALTVAILGSLTRSALVQAQAFRPAMNRAWGEMLTRVRETSAPDATVTTWWPVGYFAAYFSQRRVTADGGTLPSRRPYWLARALMAADERESAGFLRMLHCGSLARNDLGAFGKAFGALASLGLSEIEILAIVERLATIDSAEARSYLAGKGVPGPLVSELLEASHCRVPESYVLLSSLDLGDRSWQQTALWDFPRSFALAEAATRPVAAVARDLEDRFDLAAAAARSIAEAAAAHRAGAPDAFAAPLATVGGSGWSPCSDEGGVLACPLRWRNARRLELQLDAPARSRLLGAPAWGPPSFLLSAEPLGLTVQPAGRGSVEWAVLYDPSLRRAAVGSRPLLRSTYSQLMLLDGRYNRLFEKVGEAEAAHERVTAWRVRWDLLDDLS